MAKKQAHPGQLDLFLHCDATVCANDAIAALLQGDARQAGEQLRRLESEVPGYQLLGGMQTLCRALREWPWPMANPAEVAAAVRRLETEVEAAADAVLEAKAPDFMHPFWHDLAVAAEPHPYDPALPIAFSAGLHLRCHEFSEAAATAEAIPNRDANPDALYWLTLARYGMAGLEACRPSLLRLALVAPDRLAATLDEVGDAILQRDWKAFLETLGWLDDGEAAAWFPAWYLLMHPATPALSATAPLPAAPAAEALTAMERLNALEPLGHGDELVAARGRLRELAPELFGIYMERQDAAYRKERALGKAGSDSVG